MNLLSWAKRKTEAIAKEFQAGRQQYIDAYPREMANGEAETDATAAISAEECTHPPNLTREIGGVGIKCLQCGSIGGGPWRKVEAFAATSPLWRQSDGHPNWNEPPVESETRGATYAGFVGGVPGIIERRVGDKAIVAERAATKDEVKGLNAKKPARGFSQSLARLFGGKTGAQ